MSRNDMKKYAYTVAVEGYTLTKDSIVKVSSYYLHCFL